MGSIKDQIDYAYRDYNTDGVSASGDHEVLKSDVRAIGPLIEQAIGQAGLGALVAVTFATLADANAGGGSLDYADGTIGIVYADSTDANNDLIIKSGASGSGSWAPTTILHNIASMLSTQALEGVQSLHDEFTAIYSVLAGFEGSGIQWGVRNQVNWLTFGAWLLSIADDGTFQVDTPMIASLLATFADIDIRSLRHNGSDPIAFAAAGDYSAQGRILSISDSGTGDEIGGLSSDTIPQLTGVLAPIYANGDATFDGAAYEVASKLDGFNQRQVWALNKTTRAPAQLTSSGNNVPTGLTSDGSTAIIRTDRPFWHPKDRGQRIVKLDGSGEGPVFPDIRYLVNWSDSIFAGTGATSFANSVIGLTAASLGLAYVNNGIGGQLSNQVAMRMGARPTWLTISGTTIATAGTAVTAIGTSDSNGVAIAPMTTNQYPDYRLLSTRADNTTRTQRVWITDASGLIKPAQITRTASGGPASTSEAYTITSLAGAAITVGASTFRVTMDLSWQQASDGTYVRDPRACLNTFGVGTNDLGYGALVGSNTPASVLADVRANIALMAGSLMSLQAPYVIQGLYNQATVSQIAGSSYDLAIIAHDARLITDHSAARVLKAFEILAAGATSPGDDSDVANHYIPTSERADTTHPNNTGHAALANGNAGGSGLITLIGNQMAWAA